jgi:DNA mismatch repair ATPase MutS
MKVLLLHPDQDFDLKQSLPWNAADLAQDLELHMLVEAMAGEDEFLADIARRAIFSGIHSDVRTILYRQAVAKDSFENPAEVRELYELAVRAIEQTRKHGWGLGSHYPSSMLYNALELLEQLLAHLRNLRGFAAERSRRFQSEAFTQLFTMLRTELAEEYLVGVQHHLTALKFRRATLLGAQLGEYNESTVFVLKEPTTKEPSWFRRFFPDSSPYTFYLDERDEAGAQIVSQMRFRGISRVAVTLAQSADHVLGFFKSLRTELAFYLGGLNLRDRLVEKGEPICFPMPRPPGRTLCFRGLYDVCLALRISERIVGNKVDATGKNLTIITGANQGGKSTFLRSVGVAQLLMQAGMFVPAEHFAASLCPVLFTHFKRQEDAELKSGKLDEELTRMSTIVDHVVPQSLVLFNESFAATNEREGAEIARQIVTALLEKGIRVFFVTHQYELARGFFRKGDDATLFLRAERKQDGTRTFRLLEGPPLETSHGMDLYRQIWTSNEGGSG